jgi:hypothetical protein
MDQLTHVLAPRGEFYLPPAFDIAAVFFFAFPASGAACRVAHAYSFGIW